MPDDHKAAWLALRHAIDALESAEYLLSTVRDAPARGVRQQIGPLREQVSRWAAVLERTRPATEALVPFRSTGRERTSFDDAGAILPLSPTGEYQYTTVLGSSGDDLERPEPDAINVYRTVDGVTELLGTVPPGSKAFVDTKPRRSTGRERTLSSDDAGNVVEGMPDFLGER